MEAIINNFVLLVVFVPLVIFFLKFLQLANQRRADIDGTGSVQAIELIGGWKEPAPFVVQISVPEAAKIIAAALPKIGYANGSWQILNIENGSKTIISCNLPCLDQSDPSTPERLDLGLIITVINQNSSGDCSLIKLHYISYEGAESKLEEIATSTGQYLDRALRQETGESKSQNAQIMTKEASALVLSAAPPAVSATLVVPPSPVLSAAPPVPPAIAFPSAAAKSDQSTKDFFAHSASYSADFFSAAKSSADGHDPIAAADPVAAPVPQTAPDPEAAPTPQAASDPVAAPIPFRALDPLVEQASFSSPYPVAPPLPVVSGGAGFCPGCSQPINPSFPFCLYCGKNL